MNLDTSYIIGKGIGYIFLFVVIPLYAWYATKGWSTVFRFLWADTFRSQPVDPITQKPAKPAKDPPPARQRRPKRTYPVHTTYSPEQKITHLFELES